MHTTHIEQRELAMRVRLERVTLLYRQLPTSIAYTVVAKLVLVAILWEAHWNHEMIAWLAIVIANQVRRVLHYRRFVREGIHDHTVDRWEAEWVRASALSGLLWGATAILFWDTSRPSEQLLVSILVFGAATAAIPLISSHVATAYAFTIPALLPFAVRAGLADVPNHYILMIVEAIIMLAILSFSRNHARNMEDLLRIRFENEALAEQLKQRNSELARANEATQRLSQAKSQFFAAASHDLRQPLHALGLLAGALNEKPLEPAVAHLVTNVRASIDALNALFGELLDLSKIDAGAIQVSLEHFQACKMLDRLRTEFEPVASEKGLRLSVRTCTAWLHSDPILLERILRNLLSNALRYTERGGVLLGCRRRGERILFEVWDTGIGIPAAEQSKVFDEFYQAGNLQRSARRGLGLGLSIVKRLCDLLGGYEMTLASRPGRGTLFRFSVPAGVPPAPVARTPQSEPSRVDIKGALIAVIDDDDPIVEGMRLLLTEWGTEVITSRSGDDVLDKVYAAGRMPDVIVADYWLEQGKTGIHVIDRLHRELDPEIPAILLTGTTTPRLIEEAARLGYSLLLKPADPNMLRTVIASKLKQRASV